MTTIVIIFVLATLVSALVTFLMIVVERRAGMLDKPDGYRKLHVRPVPRIGGVGIYIGMLIPLFVLYVFGHLTLVSDVVFLNFNRALGLYVGGLLALSLGIIDDVFDIRPFWKFLGQIICGIVAYWFGFKIGALTNPLGLPLELGWMAFPVTVFWFVACMNAINFLDGLDGLAAGVVLFVCFVMMSVGFVYKNIFGLFFMSILAGAVFGFLIFNFHPAKIFLGDSGSMLLGFMVAGISLAGSSRKAETAIALFIPIVALGLPMFDMFLAVVRRWYRGLPVSFPDREHIHHMLLKWGYTPQRAVVILYLGSIVLGLFAIMITVLRGEMVVFLMAIFFVLFFALARVFSGVRVVEMYSKLLEKQNLQRKMFDIRMKIERMKGTLSFGKISCTEAWELFKAIFQELNFSSVKFYDGTKNGECYFEWHDEKCGPEVSKIEMTMEIELGESRKGILYVEQRGEGNISETCDKCKIILLLKETIASVFPYLLTKSEER